jgi:hypothetical protein
MKLPPKDLREDLRLRMSDTVRLGGAVATGQIGHSQVSP